MVGRKREKSICCALPWLWAANLKARRTNSAPHGNRKGYNFDKGEAVALSFDVEKALQAAGYPLKMNIAALTAAFCLDQNFTQRHFHHYAINCFNIGFAACHIDAAHQTEGSFFPMRCEQISYNGSNTRQWVPI